MTVPLQVPDGRSGDWSIDTFTISPDAAKMDALRGLFNGSGRYATAGTYQRLLRGRTVVMSNTPDEIRDHYPLKYNATGHVLINGLGLGMCIEMIRHSEDVTRITVIENSKDVITLVAPTYRADPKVEIIHADAYDYQPPKGIRYGAVWHDIWDAICTDNLPEMARLHRKYGRRTDWQGSWMKPYLQREARRERADQRFREALLGKYKHLNF
jgi:hypothetical protein